MHIITFKEGFASPRSIFVSVFIPTPAKAASSLCVIERVFLRSFIIFPNLSIITI